jgi:hypothetical protein
MCKKKRFILFILLSLAVLGCETIHESGIDTFEGQTVFNRVGFRTDGENNIYHANRFSGGIFIPAGTECTIKQITYTTIKFTANEDEYVLTEWRIGYGPVYTRTSFYKFFVEDMEAIGLDRINLDFRESIVSGIAEVGMTKHEVFLSLGYPAYVGKNDPTTDKSRASILSRDDWYYLKSKGEKVLLRFEDQILAQITEQE